MLVFTHMVTNYAFTNFGPLLLCHPHPLTYMYYMASHLISYNCSYASVMKDSQYKMSSVTLILYCVLLLFHFTFVLLLFVAIATIPTIVHYNRFENYQYN